MFRMGEFTFLEATDPALVEAIHRLRYRIYVEEYGYEKPADHPGGLERDKFDPYSVPVAALDRKGNLVGTARMIHHCPFPLPAFELASPAWREEHKNDPNLVESSRFAMSREFRLSALDFKREMAYFQKHLISSSSTVPPSPKGEPDDFSARILIFLGLSYAMIQTGHSLGATYHLMTAERSLFVLLKRNGMRFAPIGPEVDYHGRRTPYAGDNEEMFRSVQSMQKRVLSFLSERAPAAPPALQERALSEGESFRLGGYTFEIAATEEKVNQVFQLRYRSYAEDFQLIDPILLPERRERDPYDPWSLHAVAFDGRHQMVGTVRLVLNSSMGLPCLEAADADEKNRLASSKKVAELSRLALAHPYSHAFADVLSLLLSMPLVPRVVTKDGPQDRRRGAVITLGLFRMLYRISKKFRLTGWCLLASKKTADLLERHGLHPEPLGPANSAMGDRRPVLLRFNDIEQHLMDFSKIRSFVRDISFH